MSATNEIGKKYKMVFDTGKCYWAMCDRRTGLPAAWPFEVNHSFHTALAQAGRIYAQIPKRYQGIYEQRHGIFGSPKTHIFAHIADDDVACMYQGKSKEDDIWKYNFLAQMDRVAGNVLAMARTSEKLVIDPDSDNSNIDYSLHPIIDPRKMDWEVDMNPATRPSDKPFRYMHRKIKEEGEMFEPSFIYPGYTITMRRDIMERLASAESCLLTASVAVAVKENPLYGPQFVLHFYFDRLLCIYEMKLDLPSDMDDDDDEEEDITEAAFADEVSKVFDNEFARGCRELEDMDFEISSGDENPFAGLPKPLSKPVKPIPKPVRTVYKPVKFSFKPIKPSKVPRYRSNKPVHY